MENISKKMTVLSFCAMLSVVLIHSTSLLTVEHPARWNLFCQYLITRSFTYWAVPFFFLMLLVGASAQGDESGALSCADRRQRLTIPIEAKAKGEGQRWI